MMCGASHLTECGGLRDATKRHLEASGSAAEVKGEIWMRITKTEKSAAKSVDLYEYLLKYHAEDFRMESGGSLRPLRDGFKSISIKPHANWYHEFDGSKDKPTGDNIDFMTTFYGLPFQQAVAALVKDPSVVAVDSTPYVRKPVKITLPTPDPYGQEMLQKYLHENRKIPTDTVFRLWEEGLIYQDTTANLVFVNREKTYYQVRSTYFLYEGQKKILGSGRRKPDDFWYFLSGDNVKTVYICEGAIDAISLYELNGRKQGAYVSMGGVSNQQVVDRILKSNRHIPILCVDNDIHGEKRREKNPEVAVMIPPEPYLDWNEMLQAGAKLSDLQTNTAITESV